MRCLVRLRRATSERVNRGHGYGEGDWDTRRYLVLDALASFSKERWRPRDRWRE